MTVPAAATTTDTTQTAADAAVAASTAQTDTTGQTPEQIAAAEAARSAAWVPPATKEAFDKAISDAVTAEASKYKAPDKYDLKLPDKSVVDPTVVERTAAIARELGLSQDNASKMLGLVTSEVAKQVATREEAIAKDSAPGGAGWIAAYNDAQARLLSDPLIGNGKPEVLDAKIAKANKAAATFFPKEFCDFFDSQHPYSRDPMLVQGLINIGDAMGEKGLVKPQGTPPEAPKKQAEVFYPNGPDLVEGDPRLNQPAVTT